MFPKPKSPKCTQPRHKWGRKREQSNEAHGVIYHQTCAHCLWIRESFESNNRVFGSWVRYREAEAHEH